MREDAESPSTAFRLSTLNLKRRRRPVNLDAALYAVLMGFLESYEPYEMTFAADTVRIVISLSSLPHGWDTLRVDRLRTEGGKSSLPEALEAELAKAQAPVIKNIRLWLKSLTKTTFERKEDAQELVHTLTHLVRRAGHQLMYQGQPVTLAVIMTTRQRRPSVEVRGRVDGKTKPLRCSTELPEFTIRPLP